MTDVHRLVKVIRNVQTSLLDEGFKFVLIYESLSSF